MLGLYGYLKRGGHEVYPIVPNEYPEFLQWMPGNESVFDYTRKKAEANNIIGTADLIFILDYNDAKRGADMEKDINSSKAIKVMIDHHPYPQIPVNFCLSYTQVSSTCELIYEFILAIGGKNIIDKTIAKCLYTGIMTDTGCFSYNSSQIRTFEIVSDLLGYGIEKDEIYHLIYDNFSYQRMRLLGFCLNEKMEYLADYKSAFITLTMEEQKQYDFNNGDSEGFVNLPLSIKGVVFSALFIERKDKIRISFRSRGNFSVNLFSGKHFSGGGHFNAAGGESNLSMAETIKKFTDILPLYIDELNRA
jgi:phosphoesterase RecJ-like protein